MTDPYKIEHFEKQYALNLIVKIFEDDLEDYLISLDTGKLRGNKETYEKEIANAQEAIAMLKIATAKLSDVMWHR